MVRFFFDIRDDAISVKDCVGEAFPTVDAVIAEAAGSAMAIAQDRFTTSNLQTFVVAARDEYGTRVVIATVSLKIEPVETYVLPAFRAPRQVRPSISTSGAKRGRLVGR